MMTNITKQIETIIQKKKEAAEKYDNEIAELLSKRKVEITNLINRLNITMLDDKVIAGALLQAINFHNEKNEKELDHLRSNSSKFFRRSPVSNSKKNYSTSIPTEQTQS